jgi:MFS family permease
VTSDRSVVVRAAAVLGLVWLGDALIYVVLPLHAPAFGISLALVGVVLSVNRIVRILGYGWVSTLSRRFGMRALTASAALGAALSTLAYGLFTGLIALLVARLVWGMAYGALNVTITAYAIGDGRETGRRVGLNRAVSTLGPTLALSVGAWLALSLGPRGVFVAMGLVGVLAVPIALTLPRELATESTAGRGGSRPAPVVAQRALLRELRHRRRVRDDALPALRRHALARLRAALCRPDPRFPALDDRRAVLVAGRLIDRAGRTR